MPSPDQVASQGPGGFLNLNGGPTDPYYALSDGSSYASLAAACAAVPTAARRNRTVSVAGQEYQWVFDLSDAGLLPKAGGGSPSTGASGFILRGYTANQAIFKVPPGTTPDKVLMNLVPKATKPTSYDTTLDASNPTADGANFLPDSTQTLEINEIAGASGVTRSFTLVDSSDNSENSADMASDYEGSYFRFTRANGTTIEATWPATPQTITL